MSQPSYFDNLVSPASSPFRLDAAVVEMHGEALYLEPEVPDRELEMYESLREQVLEELEAPEREAFENEWDAVYEHPISRFFRVPLAALEALGKGSYGAALTLLGSAGYRSLNDLTDIIFYFRHPAVIGRKIRPSEHELQRDWLKVRDTIVRPALKQRASHVAPARPATSGGPIRTSISSAGLRWYGSGEATPQLMAFMRAVYDRQVSMSEGTFVDTLPRSALKRVEGRHYAQIAAADAATALLAAARADLAKDRINRVAIGITSGYRSADRQFEIWQGQGGNGRRGFPYYYRRTLAQRQATGTEHGPAAVALLARVMKKWIAAPGYSNHQDGLAFDFGTGEAGRGGLLKIKKGEWLHSWLVKNAERFDFRPYAGEAWHWVYRPRPTGQREGEGWEPEAVWEIEAEENPEAEQDYEADENPEAEQDYEAEENPEAEQDYEGEENPEAEQDYEAEENPEAEQDYEAEENPEAEQDYEAEENPEAEQDYEAEENPEAEQDYEAEDDSEAEQDYEAEENPEAEQDYEAEDDSDAICAAPGRRESESAYTPDRSDESEPTHEAASETAVAINEEDSAGSDELPAVPVRSDSPVENDQFHADAAYGSDEDNVVPPVWLLADRVRALLRQSSHDRQARNDLKKAVERQLRTATPYDIVKQIARHATSAGRLTMYTLLFPGEARDNTGLKDLNDKVLGYVLQQQFTERRQREIQSIFHPQFVVAGQDYKIAIFITWEQNRTEFDRRLHELDKRLRALLLKEFLPNSKKEGAKELQRVLDTDPDYRFDIYYGTDALDIGPSSQAVLSAVYLLLTQALKAAAIGRYIAKGKSLKVRVARQFGENARSDAKVDSRGKAFSQAEFLKVASAAPAIKAFMLKPAIEHTPVADYNTIYVDTVWTKAFYARQNVGDYDVIRDVRKKNLTRPALPNVKLTFAAQKELLELWLATLNLVDFIKDFLDQEFAQALLDQHDRALRILDNLREPGAPINRQRTADFLSQDVRSQRLAVLGTASEYQFYAEAADHEARIVFMMDVRDLGVEVLMMYDRTNAKILDGRLSGERLLHETFRSTERVTEMRRFTYDLVITTFRRYHALLKEGARVGRTNGSVEAARAFKRSPAGLGDFVDDVQVMLGGDEIIVAAHPRFAAYLHNIVADLSETVLGPDPLGTNGRAGSPRLSVRAGVAFSLASPAGERRARQLAHQQAMRLADESHGLLKELERRHRRIERLLDMLELNVDKRSKVPEHRRQLDALRLTKLFTRVQHGRPMLLSYKRADTMVRAWRQGRLAAADATELVGHDGKVVSYARLTSQANSLEAAVRNDVGKANIHVDPPPAVKVPSPKPDTDGVRSILRPLFSPFGVSI